MSYRAFLSAIGGEESNDWSRLSQTLASNVQKISQNVNKIQRLINQLETSEEPENLRTQLHELQETSAQLTRDTNNCLKELAELPQLVQSVVSVDQNKRNPLINNLNAFNNRKTNFLVDNNNSKQFSVEKFMAPSSLVPKKSNFYEGKTMFGGANASRAARLAGTTPYNLLQRHNLAPVLRVNVETSKRLVESSEPLSSSSQRILEKLERAATPLQDARRIPSSSSHLKSYFQTSDLLHRSSKRPKLGANPVFSQTSSQPTPFQPKRWELKLSNKEDNKVSSTETTNQLINSCDNKYLIDSNENKSNETFGGKILRKDTKKEERRLKTQMTTNGGPEDNSELLTIAKPLTMPSNLPKFNFGSKLSAKSPLTTIITKISETEDLEFKFSEPLLKTRDQKAEAILPTGKNGRKPFVFSSPLSAITQKSSNDSEKVEKESSILRQSLQKSEKIVDSISKESNISNNNKTKTETTKKESPLEKWICVCLYQNISSDIKCKACKKERFSQTKPSIPSVSLKKTTLESNDIKNTSSPITQNTGWGNKFKPASGSWSCSVCMVNNPADKTKCMACEEPKQGGNPLTTSKESPKSKCELWQCFYCKHNNEVSKNVCTSCKKIKTPIATKADLDKLYGGQTFKFGINEEKKDSKKETKKSDERKSDIFKQPVNNLIFSKSNESTPHTTTSNAFVFGSALSEEKSKLLSDSNASNDTSSGTPVFKFGVPSQISNPSSEVNPTEKSKTSITDIFGLNQSSKNSFSFGTPTTTVTSTTDTNPKASPKASSESASLFAFGFQNKEMDLLKTKKKISLESDDKNKGISDTIPNKSSDSTPLSFQIPKSSEDKQQMFKSFNSSPSGSIFGSTTTSSNTAVTTTTTVSITSFMDNKFTSKPNESQNKIIGSLFGGPATTTSFSSPFSLTNSFGSGQKSTPTAGQTNVNEANDNNKSLFSLTPSSTIKSFDSMISQTNPLVSTTSSATPNAPLSLSNSSSQQKGLVFGNPNSNLQFSSQPSTATTKPNFSFNMNSNTGATTTATTTDSAFGSNTNTLFGSNPNKGFTFGNSALNSSQTPAFSFTIPSSNSLPNTSSNLSFGLNANTTSADTNTKSAVNPLFSFGAQNSDQFSNSLTQKTLNNTNTNSKTSSQFSFGLSSNPSTGQSNNSNLFANAINPTQNSLSFNQMAPTAAPAANTSPFTFGGFGSTPSMPAMPQMQTRPQQPLPPPSGFNFSAQPSFDFGSLPNTGAQSTGPVFQFSAEQTSQTLASVATNRNIKKAKRRLNPT